MTFWMGNSADFRSDLISLKATGLSLCFSGFLFPLGVDFLAVLEDSCFLGRLDNNSNTIKGKLLTEVPPWHLFTYVQKSRDKRNVLAKYTHT